MKASELRIGNKIKFMDDGTIFTVVSIDLKGAGLENTDEFAWIEFESLEPIPLTEEWLLKFGAISNPYKDRYELPVKNEFIFIDCDQSRTPNLWMAKYPHIKYVHQLQNLYFALEGEELTLTES